MINEECNDNLSCEQKKALKLSLKRESLFITGGAGTGKSYIIKRIIKELERIKLNISVTASTGTASYNINGCTVHSALGLKHDPKKEQMYSKEISINNIDVIIIDEISMISCELFDIIYEGINEIRKKNKNNKKIQYILVGDFLQLPPVDKKNDIKFAFESKNWNKCINRTIELKINYRNKNNNYLNILKNIRNGICTNNDEKFIKNLYNNNITYDDIIPTKIFTTNKEVDEENNKNLSKLKGKLYKYKMFYEKKHNIDFLNINNDITIDNINENLDEIINNFNMKFIDLKIGAQIMIIRNISKDIYNGIRGVIVGFKDNYKINYNKIPEWKKEKIHIIKDFIENNNNVLPIIKLENNKFITLEPMIFTFDGFFNSYIDIIQLPIRLCYAITVHKSQGMSINKCIIKLNSIFTSGQTFVALSRVMDIKNVKVINFDKKKVHVNNKCVNFYKTIKY